MVTLADYIESYSLSVHCATSSFVTKYISLDLLGGIAIFTGYSLYSG